MGRYPYWLDCQWIDVTGLELGPYILEVVVNPNHKVYALVPNIAPPPKSTFTCESADC